MSSNPIEIFLSRLEKVRPNGRNKWKACCPAHPDNSPSMTITEGEAGKVVFHCFAGCPPTDIIAALGMEFSDLYPDATPTPRTGNRARDLSILKAATAKRRKGRILDPVEENMLAAAIERLHG